MGGGWNATGNGRWEGVVCIKGRGLTDVRGTM